MKRSLWWLRLAVVFFGAALIWGVDGLVVTAIVGEGYSFPGHIMRAVSTFVLVGLLFALVFRLERPAPGYYGFRPRPGWFGIGAAGYTLPFAIAAVVVLALGLATVTLTAGLPELLGRALLVLVLVLLFEAIPEELIFRGYLFRVLGERLPVWAVILVQAVLFCAFGAIIGAAVDVERQVLFALFSLALGVIRALSGTVFATIGFHAAFQLITQLSTAKWGVVVIDDPGLWFRDIAFFLAPLVLGPALIVAGVLITRPRAARSSRRPSDAGTSRTP